MRRLAFALVASSLSIVSWAAISTPSIELAARIVIGIKRAQVA